VLSKQFRELADECLGWARTARTDRERRIFLGMAETWLHAAMPADQRERKLRAGAHTQRGPSDGDAASLGAARPVDDDVTGR
jgi:hypothetical protein